MRIKKSESRELISEAFALFVGIFSGESGFGESQNGRFAGQFISKPSV